MGRKLLFQANPHMSAPSFSRLKIAKNVSNQNPRIESLFVVGRLGRIAVNAENTSSAKSSQKLPLILRLEVPPDARSTQSGRKANASCSPQWPVVPLCAEGLLLPQMLPADMRASHSKFRESDDLFFPWINPFLNFLHRAS